MVREQIQTFGDEVNSLEKKIEEGEQLAENLKEIKKAQEREREIESLYTRI